MVWEEFKRRIRLYLTFMRSFYAANIILSLVCFWLLFKNGISIFGVLFYFKVITLGVIVYTINSIKKKEYYYYENLGIGRMKLWMSIILFDMLCYLLFCILILAVI